MKEKKPSREDLLSSCSDIGPDDGIDPRTGFRLTRPRVKNRKALQLCAQVAEALNGIFGECADDLLRELTVVSVAPAPSSAYLLVTLAVAGEVDPLQVLERVERAGGLLRSQIAAAIHRKRTPLLTYRVVGP
ncbi:MAG: hypothetical protein K2R98_32305 [Gemmataceae bacterium]|nr:hypothetical protein [Gemmataceae bacterium]